MRCCWVTRQLYLAPRNQSPARRNAVHALPGGRLRLEAGFGDRSAADLAHAVGAGVELLQGALDLGQRLHEAVGQRLDLAPLRRDLPRVGEPLIEGEAGAEVTHLLELPPDTGAFLFQVGALGR